MDMESGKQQFIAFIKKYQYVLLIVLIGMFLMLLPEGTKEPEPENLPIESTADDLEEKLAEILSQIAGVGEAKVLLTEASGSDTIYQMDAGQNQHNMDTVIVTDDSREERGLIKQILPPVYRGAVIVCQGAESANVRLCVVEAVRSVTGLPSDCITVLKMK